MLLGPLVTAWSRSLASADLEVLAKGLSYDLADRGVIGVGSLLHRGSERGVESYRDDVGRARADERPTPAGPKSIGGVSRLCIRSQSVHSVSVRVLLVLVEGRFGRSGIGVTFGE